MENEKHKFLRAVFTNCVYFFFSVNFFFRLIFFVILFLLSEPFLMMFAKVVFVLLSALTVSSFGISCATNIMYDYVNKTYRYDLSGFGTFQVGAGNYGITFGICQDVSAYTKCPKGTAVCGGIDYVPSSPLGALKSQEFSISPFLQPGMGLVVSYTDGQSCGSGSSYRTDITLVCDKTTDGEVISVSSDLCRYRIEIYTKYACGSLI